MGGSLIQRLINISILGSSYFLLSLQLDSTTTYVSIHKTFKLMLEYATEPSGSTSDLKGETPKGEEALLQQST